MRIFDGHNDTLQRCARAASGADWSFLKENDAGHLDLPRARRGGFAGGFFAIFTPPQPGTWAPHGRDFRKRPGGHEVRLPPPLDHDYALEFTLRHVDALRDLEAQSDAFRLVTRADALEPTMDDGALAVVLHIEGAEAIAADLSNLAEMYDLGLRSIGPVWSRPNAFGHGVPFKYPSTPDTGPGLTDAGRALVAACQELGILVDLAHMNAAGFEDVAAMTERPLVSTHTAAHAIAPTARNLTDAQIDAIGASDGVMGVTFFVGDLWEDGRYDDASLPLEKLAHHVAYVADRIGVDHVALGSDFDGALMPEALGDVSGLPALVDALRAVGFDDDELEKIAWRNWVRVLGECW